MGAGPTQRTWSTSVPAWGLTMLLKPPPPPPKDEPRRTSPRGRTGEVFHHIGSPTACWSSSNNTSEVDGAPGFRTSVLPGLSAVALVMVAAPLTSGGNG